VSAPAAGICHRALRWQNLPTQFYSDIITLMATMNISLPEELREFVETRVAEASYSTVSDYMRELIRQDQLRVAERRLANLLADGLASGDSMPVDADYWQRKHKQTLKRPHVRKKAP
jgi:antitoxin ParD1/3/4